MIDHAFATRFVSDWIGAWNAHDLDRILAHYVDDFEMSSPLIVEMGAEPTGTLEGKAAVGAYWGAALDAYPDLRFEHVATFVGVDSVLLQFRWSGGMRAEMFLFGEDGKVERAYAHHAEGR